MEIGEDDDEGEAKGEGDRTIEGSVYVVVIIKQPSSYSFGKKLQNFRNLKKIKNHLCLVPNELVKMLVV